MTKRIHQLLIRLLVHPFHKDEPVDFKLTLRNAENVLIAVPSLDVSQSKLSVDSLTRLFKKNTVVVVEHCPKDLQEKAINRKKLKSKIIVDDISTLNFWQLKRSKDIEKLTAKSYDVLFDLDPEVNILHYYLCYSLRPPVRISFSKDGADQSCNLVYKDGKAKPLQERIDGLASFLELLLMHAED